jgi:hypothetical protein
VQRRDETLRSYIQRWNVIKNSAEDVSDERAIDAFSAGLRRSTTNEHDRQKMTEETDTDAKEGDPAITITMAPIVK